MRFSDISWTKDAQGLLLLALSGAAQEQGARSGALGPGASTTTASARRSPQDLLVYERKDLPGWIVSGGVTEDGRYLLRLDVPRAPSNQNRLYYADLGEPRRRPTSAPPVRPSSETTTRSIAPFGNHGSAVYLRSDKDAPNRKVIAVDLSNPRPPAWKTIVPEQQGGDRERRPHRRPHRRAVSGGRAEPAVASSGSTAPLRARSRCRAPARWAASSGRERRPDVWYTLHARRWRRPRSTRYDPAHEDEHAASRRRRRRSTRAQFETKALFATSKDGTRVPLLPDREEGPAARRQQPDDAVRLRRVFGQHAARPIGRTCRRGSSWAASG